jgi:O-antigen ligase
MFVTVAWGVLSFGAVYPWAYWPLLILAAATGTWSLRGSSHRASTSWPIALAAIGIAIALQLVPLPSAWLERLNPHGAVLISQYDVAYATVGSAHPLSIDPRQTTLGLVCFVALALFAAGCARRLTTAAAATFARLVTVLAVLVAVIGVVQKASGTLLIYGFWRPFHHPYQIFGPFVNRNHYAGWMVMASSLALGSIAGTFAVNARRMPRAWRERVLWLSSPDANYLLVGCVGLPLIAVALLMTLSRSGITAFAVALSIGLATIAVRTRRNRLVGLLIAGYSAAAIIMISGWSRLDAVAQRFQGDSGVSLAARVWTWRDAARIMRDHPVFGTGLNTFDAAMIFYQSQAGGHWDAAHNDYVQLLAEGGMWLCVPIVVAICLYVRDVQRRFEADRQHVLAFWLRTGAILGLIAIGLQEAFDFSLQLPGNAVMFAALLAVAGHDSGRSLKAGKSSELGRKL